MKLLLLFLHLLPSFDQLIAQTHGYWIGFITRSFSHFGVPFAWERDWRTTYLSPFEIKNKKVTLIYSLLGSLAAAALIYALFLLLKPQLDFQSIKTQVATLYPLTKPMYLAVGLVISFVNPLMEEFYWRGFLYRKYAQKGGGIWIGLLFALHHIVIFHKWFAPVPLLIASVGLAATGVFFNWLYKQTDNLWSCLLVHATADITIIAIGYGILFG